MTSPFPLVEFGVALFVGALVGIERERRPPKDREVGGIRTFTLFALAGALAAWVTTSLATPWPLVAGVGAVTAIVVADRVAQGARTSDLATHAAALAVCLLGGAAVLGFPELAIALGITVSALLAFKDPLHGFVARIGRDDLFAALKLLLAAFVVLPFLPDRAVDPWGAVNPRTTGLLAVLVSALSFAGYVAVRLLGAARGLAATGVFGGLVSSTAVTLGLSRRSRDDGSPAMQDALGAAVLLSWVVMNVRVVAIVAFVHRPLAGALWVPMAALGGGTLAVALVLLRRGRTGTPPESDVALRNPFSLSEAVKFAVAFTAVVLLIELVRAYLPPHGVYAVAALAGATDVDAISLSLANLAARGQDSSAAGAILCAALSNTVVKAGIACVAGSPALRRRVLAGAAAGLAATAAAAVVA